MFVATPHFVVSSPTASVVLGATDPGSSRLVYAMVIGLVVVGIALVVLGIWIIRQTRTDLEVLAPLERMGDRDWRKRDPATQRRLLDELRPDGAEPLAAQAPPPPLDVDFEQSDHPVTSLSDLGPGVLTADDPSGVSAEERDAADEPDVADTGSDNDLDSDDAGSEVEVDDAADEPEPEVVDVEVVEVEDAADEPEVVDVEVVDVEVVDVEVEDAADEPETAVIADAADEPKIVDDEVEDPTDVADDRSDLVAAADEPADVGNEGSDEVAMGEEQPVGDDDERVDDVAADQR